jgi:hypothetical protein
MVRFPYREAKPRPTREENGDSRVWIRKSDVLRDRIFVSVALGAVLPQPGLPVHLPGGEKSGLTVSG